MIRDMKMESVRDGRANVSAEQSNDVEVDNEAFITACHQPRPFLALYALSRSDWRALFLRYCTNCMFISE